MKKRVNGDDLELLDVIILIWNNKLKLVAITAIFIVMSVALYSVNKPSINIKSKILPVTFYENNLYNDYNFLIKFLPEDEGENKNKKNVKILQLDMIDKEYLLDLFLEELNTQDLYQEAIKRFKINASRLNILRPIKSKNNEISMNDLNWRIEFKINNDENLEDALIFLEFAINNKIRNFLEESFYSKLNYLKLIRQYKIEDLKIKIENAKKNYDVETVNHLTFLKEQALIARKMGLRSNPDTINSTREVQEFTGSSTIISNSTEFTRPYYLRGYDVIEKEIELIETRTNKNAFIRDLLKLENQKRELVEDKSLERLERAFKITPVVNGNNFKAANIDYSNTQHKISISLIKVVFFAGLLGIVFGLFYILISNIIKKRKLKF